MFVAIKIEHADGVVQFRCQLNPGGAATYDGHGDRFTFMVGVQAGIEETLTEAFRLGAAVHEQAIVAYPGGAEVVALAAGGQDQIVVTQLALREDFAAMGIVQGRQGQRLPGGIHLGQGAGFKPVMVELGVGAVIHRIQVRIDGAGGDFMKAGFPDVDVG